MENDRFIHHYSFKPPQFNYLHSVADPPTAVPVELHESHELCFFYRGDITFFIEGNVYQVRPGDILIIANTELHRAVVRPETSYERTVIHFKTRYLTGFQPDDFDLLNFVTKRMIGHQNRIDSSQIDTSRVYALLDQIGDIIEEGRPECDLMVKTVFVELLVEVRRTYNDNWGSVTTPTQTDIKIKEILKYINDNLASKITLESLKAEFFISKYYLCHVFKKTTGFTVMEYLTNKRIMQAKQLLIDGSTAADACFDTGFGDYSNFYKVFKRATGKSPQRFAKEH